MTMPNSSPPSRASTPPGRHHRGHRRADLAHQVVAGVVAKGVVDQLEAVEVDQQDGLRAAIAGQPRWSAR